ncbi:hypothetical protein QYF36_001570 [Acer negundo]|nr:hypothetical protein QYF36_001570 [Acer negundo]
MGLSGESTEKANFERTRKGKQVKVEPEFDDEAELVESDYEQEVEDIATETCVDPTNLWDSFQVLDLQESDDGRSENLSSLDGFDGEEDEGLQPRKFIKTRYHEFTPSRDMQNPVFRLGIEFGSGDIFRKAIKEHAVKHKRVVQFKKIDSNRVSAICKAECCK